MPELNTAIATIRASALLNNLTDDQAGALAGVSKLQKVDRREVIWLNGNDVEFCGIVVKGFVHMVTNTGDQEVTTEIMGPGQVFGLLGVIDGKGCPQMARALCATIYLRVPKAAILEVYHANQMLKARLVDRTSNRLRRAMAMMVKMSTGSVPQRIASVLLLLADSYGEPEGHGVRINIQLTRQDIADMAGTTLETTIRTMSKWSKQGQITTDKKFITLSDPSTLQKL